MFMLLIVLSQISQIIHIKLHTYKYDHKNVRKLFYPNILLSYYYWHRLAPDQKSGFWNILPINPQGPGPFSKRKELGVYSSHSTQKVILSKVSSTESTIYSLQSTKVNYGGQ